ncbi:MAG: TspO/MBR family protein [Candidatus Limivicinus sp.]
MTQKLKWKKLLPALALPLVLGAFSAWLNRGAMAGYAALSKPPLSPPAWLFPVIWTLLYLLMGLAAYLVAVSPASCSRRQRALNLYLIQLGFNFFWSSLFFGLGAWFAAFLWLLLLLGLSLPCCLLFWHIDRRAGALLLPYLLWLLFAAYLNLALWLIN